MPVGRIGHEHQQVAILERPRQQIAQAGVQRLPGRQRIGRIDDPRQWLLRKLRAEKADG